MAASLEAAIASTSLDDPAILTSDGIVYAARNVLILWPASASVWVSSALLEPLRAILGPRLGVVRALFIAAR